MSARMSKAEREAWQTLLDIMVGTGEMVPLRNGLPTPGLCSSLYVMCAEGAVDALTAAAMHYRINRELERRGIPRLSFLFPAGAVAPRIKWIRNQLERHG